MLAFACLLPSTAGFFRSCVGVEVLQDRVVSANSYLSVLQVCLSKWGLLLAVLGAFVTTLPSTILVLFSRVN
jgi:hypothetical protein